MKKNLLFTFLTLVFNCSFDTYLNAEFVEIECTIEPIYQGISKKSLSAASHSHREHKKSHCHSHSHSHENSHIGNYPITSLQSIGYGPQPMNSHAIIAGTSANWSGYAVETNFSRPQANSINAVEGSWTVPSLHPTPDYSYCATWVGIDGYSSPTVEQIGTEQEWTTNGQYNYAWFEMYPRGFYQISGFPVNRGDSITGSVTYKGNNVFTLKLTNNTAGVYTIIPSSYTTAAGTQRSSAEWIVEAPSSSQGVLPLANFGNVAFTNCFVTIKGIKGTIGNSHWQHDAITMASNGVIKAIPSSLSTDGSSFSVTWEHE